AGGAVLATCTGSGVWKWGGQGGGVGCIEGGGARFAVESGWTRGVGSGEQLVSNPEGDRRPDAHAAQEAPGRVPAGQRHPALRGRLRVARGAPLCRRGW